MRKDNISHFWMQMMNGNLISEIKRRVFDGYGVELMTEVQIVGEE